MNEEFVTIPFYIESDGTRTLFLPEVRLSKGFHIGKKGAERYIDDYWEALSALMEMPSPRFRRRNRSNIPGIVKCNPESVEEVKRSYIVEQLLHLEREQTRND